MSLASLKVRCFFILVFLVIWVCHDAAGQNNAGTPVSFTSKKFPGKKLTYLIYKPAGYKAGTRIPLLVYLHGSGVVGNDIEKVKTAGIPKLIEEGTKYPWLVIAPQLPADMNNRWDPVFVNEFLEYVLFYNNVDRSSIYFTGYSMGAAGVWDYCVMYPQRAACAVPVSGWGDKEKVCSMKDIPVWTFHGSKDATVDVSASRKLTSALNECKGNATLTEFADGNHDVWRKAFTYPGLLTWINMRSKRVLAIKDRPEVKSTPNETVKEKPKPVVKETPKPVEPVPEPKLKGKLYKLPQAAQNTTGIAMASATEWYGVSPNARPYLVRFDTTGKVNLLIKVNGASNLAWSDLCTTAEHLYILDGGNPNLKRKYFQVFRIRLAEIGSQESVNSEKIEFTLPNESLDIQSMFVYNDQLFFLGRNVSNQNQLIRVGNKPGEQQVAVVIGPFEDLKKFNVTSAVVDPAAKKLYVLDPSMVGEIDISNGPEAALKNKVRVRLLESPGQKGGITLNREGKIVIADQISAAGQAGNLHVMFIP